MKHRYPAFPVAPLDQQDPAQGAAVSPKHAAKVADERETDAGSRPPDFFEWREAWTLNIGFMDDDHQALVALVNQIAACFGAHPREGDVRPDSAMVSGASLPEALEKLGRHARGHFDREEAFMRAIRYPDLASHKTDHDLLMAEYTELLGSIRQSGAHRLSLDTLHDLKSWLMGHILDPDRQLATYYFEKRRG